MEADAGKSTHPAGKDYSLVDLNRAGTPLIEIVSEPDMHSAAEAKAYTRELYLRMRYADVSDCNLYYGNMRFDVNVSVSKTDELGTRTETKNINSFRAVEKTVDYEVNRQIEELEKGNKIIQETRGWDDAKMRTFSQRTKENADDYRYFPDPDLPPIILTDDYISEVKAEMPVMPDEWRARLSALGLDKSQIETLLESNLDFEDEEYLTLLHASTADGDFSRQLVNWIVNIDVPFMRYLQEQGVGSSKYDRGILYKEVYRLAKEGKLSSNSAKSLIETFLNPNTVNLDADVETNAKSKGFIQVSDEGEIQKVVEQVIADNPKPVEDIKNGEMKAIGFLVGQVMKASQGKANPGLAQQLIKKQLGL
jgi:aspartyl-tRNA(Asn)/glutamyl-tRNA(Gln) amidotransferase subunit B